MSSTNGYVIEEEMCLALHRKLVKDLSTHLRFILEELYGPLEANEMVECYATESFIKPDINIYYKGIRKGVSIKTGACDVLHDEYIDTFVNYLREIGVSEKTQRTYLLYQFGDGTTDGTGKRRMDGEEVRKQYYSLLEDDKKEINENYDFIEKIVERVIFVGVNPDEFSADAVYHGDVYSGTIVTKRQIMRHIRRNRWTGYRSFNVGPLLLYPHARYAHSPVASEKRRNHINIKWPNLIRDMEYMSKRYYSIYPKDKWGDYRKQS